MSPSLLVRTRFLPFTALTILAFAASSAAYANGDFKIHTGAYTCELGRSIEVKKVAADHSSVVIRHAKKDYTLKAVETSSGALRFENKAQGRAWVVLVGNSMFLDAKRGQRLANACVAT
jgi:membrane-bound inhibitor of C-type lysozyme